MFDPTHPVLNDFAQKKRDEYHLFWTNFLPHRVILNSMFQRVSDTSSAFKRHKIHLQDTTLHHDLHAIGRNAGGVVHGVLEHGLVGDRGRVGGYMPFLHV